jgi:hypothetical protein
VKRGSDLIRRGVRYWDYPSASYVTTGAQYKDGSPQNDAFSRFCSGTLWGGGDRTIWFANEENGDGGRVFGVLADGTTRALPRLGLASWENTKPAATRSSTTFIVGNEDGGDASQLWAYVGQNTFSDEGERDDKGDGDDGRHDDGRRDPFDAAGLTNGALNVFAASNPAVTDDATWRAVYGKGVDGRVQLASVNWDQSGALLNAEAKAKGLNLDRIEDGHWDPRHPNDFYFVTTEGGQTDGSGLDARDGGGLWRLRVDDVDHPELGGALTLLLDGSESFGATEPKLNKPDNVVVDREGNVLVQEDPGRNNHIARVVAYRIADGARAVVARFDPALFGPGADEDPSRLTVDEESSGIIDTARQFGRGTYLFDAQVHTTKGLPPGTGPATAQEYVERGQLLLMHVTDWPAVYG